MRFTPKNHGMENMLLRKTNYLQYKLNLNNIYSLCKMSNHYIHLIHCLNNMSDHYCIYSSVYYGVIYTLWKWGHCDLLVCSSGKILLTNLPYYHAGSRDVWQTEGVFEEDFQQDFSRKYLQLMLPQIITCSLNKAIIIASEHNSSIVWNIVHKLHKVLLWCFFELVPSWNRFGEV